jgi:hypothetical protein
MKLVARHRPLFSALKTSLSKSPRKTSTPSIPQQTSTSWPKSSASSPSASARRGSSSTARGAATETRLCQVGADPTKTSNICKTAQRLWWICPQIWRTVLSSPKLNPEFKQVIPGHSPGPIVTCGSAPAPPATPSTPRRTSALSRKSSFRLQVPIE